MKKGFEAAGVLLVFLDTPQTTNLRLEQHIGPKSEALVQFSTCRFRPKFSAYREFHLILDLPGFICSLKIVQNVAGRETIGPLSMNKKHMVM